MNEIWKEQNMQTRHDQRAKHKEFVRERAMESERERKA